MTDPDEQLKPPRRDAAARTGTSPTRASSQRRRMNSLQTRVLLSEAVSLSVFLVVLALILDQAVVRIARDGVEARLETQIYMLLGATNLDVDGEFRVAEPLPEPVFRQPGSSSFARVYGSGGEVIWASESSVGRPQITPPFLEPGRFSFFTPAKDSAASGFFFMHFNVVWEAENGALQRDLTLQVAETRTRFAEQIGIFRGMLLRGFLLVGICFLAFNSLLLRHVLSPLRKLSDEVRQIELGERELLSGGYPSELQILADNLGILIRQGQGLVARYRNALADLAHSLKNPLAVLKSSLNAEASGVDEAGLLEQVDRIGQAVDYQLKRATAAQQTQFGRSVEVAPLVAKLVRALSKVYAEKQLEITFDVAPGSRFQGDAEDFYEMLGNLADNACKWARSRVAISVQTERAGDTPRRRLLIDVVDDGPGLTAADFARLRARGARGDRSVSGQGIGLAVVCELVEATYAGEISLLTSEVGTHLRIILGGMRPGEEVPSAGA